MCLCRLMPLLLLLMLLLLLSLEHRHETLFVTRFRSTEDQVPLRATEKMQLFVVWQCEELGARESQSSRRGGERGRGICMHMVGKNPKG